MVENIPFRRKISHNNRESFHLPFLLTLNLKEKFITKIWYSFCVPFIERKRSHGSLQIPFHTKLQRNYSKLLRDKVDVKRSRVSNWRCVDEEFGWRQSKWHEREIKLTRNCECESRERYIQLFDFIVIGCSYYVVCWISWVPVRCVHFALISLESIFMYCSSHIRTQMKKVTIHKDTDTSPNEHTNWMNRVKKVVGISRNLHMFVGISLFTDILSVWFHLILIWFGIWMRPHAFGMKCDLWINLRFRDATINMNVHYRLRLDSYAFL